MKSELLLPGLPDRIWEVSVERELQFFNFRGDGMMKTLNRIGTRRDVLECTIEMRKIFELRSDMKFSEMRRTETEFSSRYPIATDSSGRFQVAEIRINVSREVRIENSVRKIAPDGIDVDEPYLTAD